jgi:hypothetical protein
VQEIGFFYSTRRKSVFLPSSVEKDTENNGINNKCGSEQGYRQNVLLEPMWAGANSDKKQQKYIDKIGFVFSFRDQKFRPI